MLLLLRPDPGAFSYVGALVLNAMLARLLIVPSTIFAYGPVKGPWDLDIWLAGDGKGEFELEWLDRLYGFWCRIYKEKLEKKLNTEMRHL